MRTSNRLTDAEAWAALRRTTEALAREIARPTDDTPEWTEDEWLIARAAASMHGVSPLLARTSRWRGPPGWHEFLDEQLAHTTERQVRIASFLELLDNRARESGIALVALKGAALHAIGLYQAGERPMGDVDLLARSEEAAGTASMLQQMGFTETLRVWKHQVFELIGHRAPEVFGEHAANAIKIDLHFRLGEKLPMRIWEIEVFPREARAGVNPYASRAVLLLHLLLHAAGGMCFRSLRLIHLNDIARLAALMTEADWGEFLKIGARLDRALWWAFPPLALTARYFGSIPERVLSHELLDCRQPLKHIVGRQTLTDVSLSNPRLSAFPGIEWARSVTEALAYVRWRVAPDAQILRAREYLARTQPSLRAWGKLSQAQRIWRWLVVRPPRHEPLFAVRTALEQRALPSRGDG